MSANRSAVRNELTSLLTAALVGTGLPCQAVYGYQPATFDGQSPVVTVSSASSQRPPMTHQGARATFGFYIHVFVLYADKDSGWDEQDAEDRLDLIEATITETLTANRVREGYWNNLHFETTTTSSVEVGGDEYRSELIDVFAEVYS